MKTSNKQTKKLFQAVKAELEEQGATDPAASIAAMSIVARTYEMIGLKLVKQLSEKELTVWLQGYGIKKKELINEFFSIMAEVVQ